MSGLHAARVSYAPSESQYGMYEALKLLKQRPLTLVQRPRVDKGLFLKNTWSFQAMIKKEERSVTQLFGIKSSELFGIIVPWGFRTFSLQISQNVFYSAHRDSN